MQNLTGIIIIMLGYLLALGFGVIGIVGLKKVEKEFSKSNFDVSKMERKKRLPYLIYTLIGYFLPVITSIILILVLLSMG